MNNKKVIKYIKSDFYRYYGNTSFLQMFYKYFRDRIFRFHVAFRMCQGEKLTKFLGKILWHLSGGGKTIY